MTVPIEHKIRSELMTSDGWKYRRALLFSVTFFMCGVVAFLAYTNTGSPIALMLTPYLFAAIMSFVMAYVFGAIWDDKNKRTLAGSLGSSLTGTDDVSDASALSPTKPAQ